MNAFQHQKATQQIDQSQSTDLQTNRNNTESLLQQFSITAKKLHRAATSVNKVTALPILRRLINHQVLQHTSLVELFSNQSIISSG